MLITAISTTELYAYIPSDYNNFFGSVTLCVSAQIPPQSLSLAIWLHRGKDRGQIVPSSDLPFQQCQACFSKCVGEVSHVSAEFGARITLLLLSHKAPTSEVLVIYNAWSYSGAQGSPFTHSTQWSSGRK